MEVASLTFKLRVTRPQVKGILGVRTRTGRTDVK